MRERGPRIGVEEITSLSYDSDLRIISGSPPQNDKFFPSRSPPHLYALKNSSLIPCPRNLARPRILVVYSGVQVPVFPFTEPVHNLAIEFRTLIPSDPPSWLRRSVVFHANEPPRHPQVDGVKMTVNFVRPLLPCFPEPPRWEIGTSPQ